MDENKLFETKYTVQLSPFVYECRDCVLKDGSKIPLIIINFWDMEAKFYDDFFELIDTKIINCEFIKK